MKSQIVVVALAVIGVLASAFTAYQVATSVMSDQVIVSCRPDPGRSYCVYHRTTPGLLATEYVIHVGIAPNRGLFYEIPYPAGDVAATWNPDTALLTIAMPGTELKIAEAEYRDR
ncbi:hypothetical protein ACFWPX_20715 [Nocardia sp. NPDC058518]|uniref:hypothetical protein n=1 Tax=Nocardia sp. NPDC058518 TaxID=3346534 RepID=UPI00365F22FF